MILCSALVYAKPTESDIYCPIISNARWTYNIVWKNNSKPPYDRVTEIIGKENYDGVTYYVFYVPEADGKFLLAKDDKAAYIKLARYAVPFLSFIHFDVVFEPVVYAIQFPLQKGVSWHYEGVASLKAIGIFNFPTKVWGRCTNTGIETIEADGRTMNAYRLYAELEREGVSKTFRASFWFGEGVGLARYESETIVMTLKSFEIKSDAVNNTF